MAVPPLTVARKLGLSFGVIGLLLVLVAWIAIRALGVVREDFEAFAFEDGARVAAAHDLLDAANARAIGARNMVLSATPADRDAQQAAVLEAHAKVQAMLAELHKATAAADDIGAREKELLARIDAVEARYGPVAQAVVAAAAAGRRDEAITKMNAECRPLLADLLAAAGAYQAHLRSLTQDHVALAQRDFERDRALLLGIVALSIVLGGVLTVAITRGLVRALGDEPEALGRVAQQVAAGDLRPLGGADAAPERSVLASLAAMQQGLAGLVGQVRLVSDSIATGSTQIAGGNADLSRRTEEQAANLQQTAASMEQLNTAVRQHRDTAREAATLAGSASAAVQEGGRVVGDIVATMQDISASSHRIADIIGVIDGIAFQTNILALNAAVEAARAGEQGRGFAVVAGEVRTLAQRSAEAAREIKGLIGASVEKVDGGSRLVAEAGASMERIVGQVRHVSELIAEMTSASEQQTAGIGQVNDAVSQLDRVTQQNAALVEESAAAAGSLQQQAGRLSELVAVFRV